MSDIVNIKNLDELDAEYVLICKDADDIFNDIKFNNKKEEDTCRMIVDFIEKTVSQGISNFKAMSLPFIGVLRLPDLRLCASLQTRISNCFVRPPEGGRPVAT